MPTRRDFLRLSFSPRGPERDVLVQVFLRGGADGLNLVAPFTDPGYRGARPTLGLPPPDASGKGRLVDLDGRFGLNPALSPLLEDWTSGELAIVHAAGSTDETRSHFEAQDLMERGNPEGRDMGSGWIARHLRTAPGRRGALSGVAIADVLPESLRGAPSASAVARLDEFSVRGAPGFAGAMAALYGAEPDALGAAGTQVLSTLAAVERLRDEAPGNGSFADNLRQVARLARAEVGLEAACVDLGGWDTHFVQPALLDGLAAELASGLAAFRRELGSHKDRVTIVVLTEFGRRVAENVSFGTDHGRGSVMFVLGRGIRGGRVHGRFPALTPELLEGPGDLPVTTDYRDVLAELLRARLGNPDPASVFPGREFRPVGLA